MRIYVDESPTGAGKTYHAIERLVAQRCKALFITERVQSFDEVESMIRQSALRKGARPLIRRIHAGDLHWSNSVSREVEELPDFYRHTDHIVVIATHAAMLRSNFSDFEGWRIVVDEVPQMLDFEKRRTHLDAAFFQSHYQLDELEQGWSSVRLSEAGNAVTVADIQRDDSHRHLAVFHRRVMEASRPGARRFVLCNLPAWDAMSKAEVEWCWASAFSLGELGAFDRIELLGNRFRRDIGCEIAGFFDFEEIEWEPLPAPQRREFVHRAVHIHYFTETQSVSLTNFNKAEGQIALREIGQFLAARMPVDGSIWTANSIARTLLSRTQGLPESRYLTPRQAGTNRFRDATAAAMIYAAKPCPNLRALLKLLGIDTDKWTQSVEHETILQFATRTSIRDPDNASPVHIWVFDRKQAHYLKQYFDTLGYVTATMALVEDGPVISPPTKRGPKAAVRTPAEQDAFDKEKLARDAKRKKLARARKREREKAGSEIPRAA